MRLAVAVALATAASGCATSYDLRVDAEPGEVALPAAATATPVPIPTPDPSPTPVPTSLPAPTATPEPVAPPPFDDAIDLYFADVEAYWNRTLEPVWGVAFEPVGRRVPYDPGDRDSLPSCDGEVGVTDLYAENAFYCEPDDYIAWDEAGLFAQLYDAFGDFAMGLVIAHEYAHAVQARADQRGPTIFVELQADCMAGAWAGSVEADPSNPLRVDAGDLDAAIGGFLSFADPLGTPASDPGAHGSGFDRLAAFSKGLASGIDACTDFLTDPPTPAFVAQLGSAGGDLPLDDLLPLLAPDLDTYLLSLGAERSVPFSLLGEPTVVTAAASDACPDPALDATDLAFFCPDDERVYIERIALDELWVDAGDFAPSYLVAHAYAVAYVRAGLPAIQPVAAVTRADCIVGVWARDVFDEIPVPPEERTHGLQLSTGDLDEGIVGLTVVPPAGVEAGTVTSFERVAAFADGFFDGYERCGI